MRYKIRERTRSAGITAHTEWATYGAVEERRDDETHGGMEEHGRKLSHTTGVTRPRHLAKSGRTQALGHVACATNNTPGHTAVGTGVTVSTGRRTSHHHVPPTTTTTTHRSTTQCQQSRCRQPQAPASGQGLVGTQSRRACESCAVARRHQGWAGQGTTSCRGTRSTAPRRPPSPYCNRIAHVTGQRSVRGGSNSGRTSRRCAAESRGGTVLSRLHQ
jgi:hypothetical protein